MLQALQDKMFLLILGSLLTLQLQPATTQPQIQMHYPVTIINISEEIFHISPESTMTTRRNILLHLLFVEMVLMHSAKITNMQIFYPDR